MQSRFHFGDFQVLWWKLAKLLTSIFGSGSHFSFKLCIHLECHQIWLTCTFLAETIYTLVKMSPLKCKFWDFWVFGSKFVTFLLSILKWQANSIPNFASFFIVITHNSPVSFKLIHFLRCIKRSNESSNFENFVCSGENFPNSSCHFPNHKSLQILHHTLVLWNITPLYFFSSNIKYFGQKQPIKM